MENNTKLDKIFIINLKHRTDRKKHILQEMKDQNITNYEFFDAIKPTSEEVDKWNPNFCSYLGMEPQRFSKYRIGCLGCLKSHLGVIKLSLSRGYKKILILEDDTKFIRPFSKFHEFSKSLKEYDMLYFCGSHLKPYEKIPNLKNVVKVIKTTSAGSYCIGEKAMRFIVSNINGYSKEIDTFYNEVIQPKFNCYCLVPHITKQLDGYSDIQAKNVSYKLSY